MKLKINPFNSGNPMTLKDAATLATITAAVIWILQFFANAQYVIIVADPAAWAFEAVKNYAVAWAGVFVTLAGLEQLIKRQEHGAE